MGFLGFSDIEDFSNIAEDAFVDCTNFGATSPSFVNILTSSTTTTPINTKDKNRCLKVGEKRTL